MNIENEYRLSLYQSMGRIDENRKVELVRNRLNGLIGVRKEVSDGHASVYRYIQEHPSDYIPRIYEVVEDDEKLIVIEEYITGNNVEDFLQGKIMDEQEGAEFALELINALKVLHHAEPMIICRDLKAENVMIDHNNRVRIVDFDISRPFCEGKKHDTVLMGTAEYAAPEQYGFFQTDNRTDIYSFGVLMNYVLTGHFPVEEVAGGRFEPIIRKCICMEPVKRYQNVEELEKDIRKRVLGWTDAPERENEAGFAIPGFRTGKIWKSILAVPGYAIIGWFTLTLELESSGEKLYGAALWTDRIILCIAFLLFVFLAADYRGWRKGIPVVRSENLWVRLAGLAGLFVVIIVAAAFVCAVAETLIGIG